MGKSERKEPIFRKTEKKAPGREESNRQEHIGYRKTGS
jgi:hypothetical protein